MPTPLSGQISFGHMREEGNKTSWVSPNYPTPGRKLDIDYAWMQSVDPNGQLQSDAAGQVLASSFYGWDSWKRPVVTNVEVQQFDDNSGYRIVWTANQGDIFRSAYIIERSTTSDFSSGVTVEGIFQYAPEASEYPTRGRKVGVGTSLLACLIDSVSYYDNAKWGSDSTDPDSAYTASQVMGNTDPSAKFAYINSSVQTVGPHWFRITPVDGRLSHTLDLIRDPGDFNGIGSEPTSPTSYAKGTIVDAIVKDSYSSDFNSYTGDNKGLYIYSDYGTYSAGNVSTTSVQITHSNVYSYYQGNGKVWVAYQTGTKGGTKVPADNDWSLLNAPLPTVTGLADDTDYVFWVCPYREGDVSKPSAPVTPGGDFDAHTAVSYPSQLNAPNITDFHTIGYGGFSITWDDVQYAETYRIYIRGYGESVWTSVQSITDDGSASFTTTGNDHSKTHPVDVGIQARTTNSAIDDSIIELAGSLP